MGAGGPRTEEDGKDSKGGDGAVIHNDSNGTTKKEPEKNDSNGTMKKEPEKNDSNGTTKNKSEKTCAEEESDILASLDVPNKLPSVIEIKKALPPHCFEPRVSTSLYYMAKDFFLAGILYYLVEWTWTALPHATQFVITPVFWLLQGTIFTAIFVVGHDGGHGSFSKFDLVNDICGNICHSFLFCPYFMWKLSHRNHHKNTGNIDKEEVYYPIKIRKEKNIRYPKVFPGFGLGFAWFIYLARGYKPRGVEHFNPFEPMFKNHVIDCVISLVFLAVWSACLGKYWAVYGLTSLIYHWAIPTLIFACFIVIITFLHHHDVEVPWYSDNLWTYVRGQISSVDRHYGWCHDIIHNIGTHQVHHLFPKIPHYHLEEATAAFRKAFPELIRINDKRILPEFKRMFHKYVDQAIIGVNTQVHVYK